MDLHLPAESGPALFHRADRHGIRQPLQVIPLPDFLRPGIAGHTKRGDDQGPGDFSPVEEFLHRSQGDDGLAEAHLQQDRGDWVRQDEVCRVFLVIMGFISHRHSFSLIGSTTVTVQSLHTRRHLAIKNVPLGIDPFRGQFLQRFVNLLHRVDHIDPVTKTSQ